ncbi:MAG: hypothetical protein JNL60_07500 [Bacteroidia bacterium]|nr:hypothetical protein [Bacteroidia bacterium]
MTIQSLLEEGHSKVLTTRIINHVGNDKERFKELMQIFLKGEYRLTQRAAWPLSYCAINNPPFIKPYFGSLIKKMQKGNHHPAITRNILRMFQEIDVPEKYCGTLLDLCITYMTSEMQPTAIRAFAITVAERICRRFPDLKNELRMILDELNQYPQLPAVKHRIKLALKDLRSA